jgi:hypothetical protein
MKRRACGWSLLLLTTLAQAEPAWQHITWQSFRIGEQDFPRAAALIPARIDGAPCLVQLDTGANAAFVPTGRNPRTRQISIEIGGHTITSTAPQIIECDRAGTVGNAFFEHGSIVLDLKQDRFAYTDDALLRDDGDATDFTYVQQAGWEGGHIVIPIVLSDGPQAAMFDTGAALFTFVPFQRSLYEALRTDSGTAFSAPSFGQQTGCEISRFTATLRVGGTTFRDGVLGHCMRAVDIGTPLAGVIGLGGLGLQSITIDYPSRKWKANSGEFYQIGPRKR